MLQKTEYDLRTLLDGIEAPASVFSEYRVDSNNPIPLIYQSGYLTIKGFDERFRNYLLEFSNDEVRYGFVDFLVPWNRLTKKVTWYLIRRMDAKW